MKDYDHHLRCSPLCMVLLSNSAVLADRFSFRLICFSCSLGLYLFSLDDRPFSSLILLSQNCAPSFLNFLRSAIPWLIQALTTLDYSRVLAMPSALIEVLVGMDSFLGDTAEVVWNQGLASETSSLSQLLSKSLLSRSFYLKISLSLLLEVLTRSSRELWVSKPRQLLATSFLERMRELRAGPIKSDSLSERSEIGCRLQLSFLLFSSFSMMLSSRSLNFSKVSISVQCCAFRSFCRSISSMMLSTDLRSSSFYFFKLSAIQQFFENLKNPVSFYEELRATVDIWRGCSRGGVNGSGNFKASGKQITNTSEQAQVILVNKMIIICEQRMSR